MESKDQSAYKKYESFYQNALKLYENQYTFHSRFLPPALL